MDFFLPTSGKEDPGNYRLVSLTSMSTKFMEQTVLKIMPRQMGNKEVTGDSISKGKLFLTNLVAFYDGSVDLMDKGKAMDVIRLDLCKEFNTVLQCQIFFSLNWKNLNLHLMD